MNPNIYAVLARPDKGNNSPKLWEYKRIKADVPKHAAKKVLSDKQLLEWEYIVIEINRATHSDEFLADGIFDDIEEKVEED